MKKLGRIKIKDVEMYIEPRFLDQPSIKLFELIKPIMRIKQLKIQRVIKDVWVEFSVEDLKHFNFKYDVYDRALHIEIDKVMRKVELAVRFFAPGGINDDEDVRTTVEIKELSDTENVIWIRHHNNTFEYSLHLNAFRVKAILHKRTYKERLVSRDFIPDPKIYLEKEIEQAKRVLSIKEILAINPRLLRIYNNIKNRSLRRIKPQALIYIDLEDMNFLDLLEYRTSNIVPTLKSIYHYMTMQYQINPARAKLELMENNRYLMLVQRKTGEDLAMDLLETLISIQMFNKRKNSLQLES